MTSNDPHWLDKNIVSVAQLLAVDSFDIPDYQRPYKWSEKNLNDLLQDVQNHCSRLQAADGAQDNKDGDWTYRLGTVVFHRDTKEGPETLAIVDGQQRILTLMLLVKALAEEGRTKSLPEALADQLIKLSSAIDHFAKRQTFASKISHQNLYRNYQAARRAVARPDFTPQHIDFLLNQCELVTFVLDDISEAFQFFDSQNARGRDLDPHDLLKAFHLREFADSETNKKVETVGHWENQESRELERLFADYLYRIRQWAKGKSARYFTKNDVDLFKGINLDREPVYPYATAARHLHETLDSYPFQLDQTIINGRRFFELVAHYQIQVARIRRLKSDPEDGVSSPALLDPTASRILETLNSYPARTRTGDRYVRNLFDCALIFYMDKFGTAELSRVVEKLFVWAYSIRLRMQLVQLATIDNHARDTGIFVRLRNATTPAELSGLRLPPVAEGDIKGSNVDEIVELLKELKYHE